MKKVIEELKELYKNAEVDIDHDLVNKAFDNVINVCRDTAREGVSGVSFSLSVLGFHAGMMREFKILMKKLREEGLTCHAERRPPGLDDMFCSELVLYVSGWGES